MKILIILTSHSQLGDTGKKTGFWVEEFAADTVCHASDTINVTFNLNVNLPRDTTICGTLQLNAGSLSGTYLWSTGETTQIITVNKPGKYWVDIKKGGCFVADTIQVAPLKLVPLNIDTVICAGKSVNINLNYPNASYLWNDGSSTGSRIFTSAGTNWVKVYTPCDTIIDTVALYVTAPPVINIGKDTVLCPGETFWLNAAAKNATYLWNNGSTDSIINVTTAGNYKVTVSTSCFNISDSIYVAYNRPPSLKLGNDTEICLGDYLLLSVSDSLGNILWQDGSTGSTYRAADSGMYKVTANNTCGEVSDSIVIAMKDCNCYFYIPSAFTPNGDGLNDIFLPSTCEPDAYKLQIFDTWGELLFTSDEINNGWDGTYNGKRCIEGLYLYSIKASRKSRTYFKSGMVNLMR